MLETNTNNSAWISLSRAAQITGYHQDYLGQLCRLGKLPATKKGRIWFTSEDALNRLAAIPDAEDNEPQVTTTEEAALDYTQPAISQNITVSQVEGLPIAIRTLPTQVRGGNTIQNIITNIRIESLQNEVMELRQLLGRLMAEVATHTNLLQGRAAHSAQDQLKHQYISNFDFNAPLSRANIQQQDSQAAAGALEALKASLEEEKPMRSKYSILVWVTATVVAILITGMGATMLTGQFFGSPETQTKTVYYHPQTLPEPTVAGATIPTVESGDLR
jgi:hypothetical protein